MTQPKSRSRLLDSWIAPLRSVPIRLGLYTGAGLIAVMAASLLAANRVPWLESFADTRLWVSYVVFLLVMLIPVGCFWRSAKRLFVSGMTAWALLSVAYAITGDFFMDNLFNRLNRSPFTVFVQGAMIYGGIAVAAWLGSLVAAARHQPIAYSRRRRPY